MLASFYNSQKEAIYIFFLAATVLLLVFHYLRYPPGPSGSGRGYETVLRFTLTERLIHLIRTVAFLGAALTGIHFVFGGGDRGDHAWHTDSGFILFLFTLLAQALYFRDSIFAPYDLSWIRRAGDYFSRSRAGFPAGKFNAGQKIFIWLTTVLAVLLVVSGIMLEARVLPRGAVLALHGTSALLLIIMIMGHAYLGTLATPGNWQVLISGRVSREWARLYHSHWRHGSR